MRECDVLVVGGGPSGSSLLWGLRDSGLDAVLVDRAAFPRDKICAGWVTPPVLDALEIDPAAYREGRTLQPLHAFRVGRVGGAALLTRRSPTPLSYGILRREFDHWLLARAPGDKQLGSACRSFVRDGDRWIVDDRYRARMVIGAGGHFCPFARAVAGGKADPAGVVHAQEIEFRMDAADADACPVAADVPELYFTRDLKGYGWVFRKGEHVNIGIGAEGGRRLTERVAEFRDWLVASGRIPASTPERWHGHAYLLYPSAPRPLAGDGFLLVGDAAGLAYPQSGEGIRPAVESALLAARVIRDAGGRYDAASLAPYAERMHERFGTRQARRPRDGEAGALKRFLAARLLGSRWLVERLVVERWFLQQHQPALHAT